jgi:hypothetical protein
MKSHEALNKAIGRQTVEHAKRLHLSTSMVHKWQEPAVDYTDSGAFNPLDRLETIIETALSLGIPLEDAYSPLHYLAQKFDHIAVPIPVGRPDIKGVSDELLKAVTEFGELAREASTALQDHKITRLEFSRIDKEAWELIRQVALFLSRVREITK